MKFVGFIKQEDKNISTAKDITEMFVDSSTDILQKFAIIEYLKKGVFVTGVMSTICDLIDGEFIGTLDYYTDGEFIWPSYYPFYLNKYKTFKIDDELFNHAQKNKFQIREMSKDELEEIDLLFTVEWTGGKYKF